MALLPRIADGQTATAGDFKLCDAQTLFDALDKELFELELGGRGLNSAKCFCGLCALVMMSW